MIKLPFILSLLLFVVVIILMMYYFWYVKPHNTMYQLTSDNLSFEHISNSSTIIDIFKVTKDKYGDKYALQTESDVTFVTGELEKVKGMNTMTYSQYWDESLSFSDKLNKFIGERSHVVILSKNRPEWFIVHMGTLMSRGVSIGIYPTASKGNCEFIINDSDVDLIIVEDSHQMKKLQNIKMDNVKLVLQFEHINDENPETIDIINNVQRKNSGLSIMSYEEFMDFPDGDIPCDDLISAYSDDTATIIYTSGTTGKPKGVVLSHKAVCSSIANCIHALKTRSSIEINAGETFISYLPLNHIAAQLMDIYVPISVAGFVHCARPDALKGSLKTTLKKVKPTVFIGVPRVWQKIKEGIHKQISGNSLTDKLKRYVARGNIMKMLVGLDKAKYCISAAAPLDIDTRAFFSNIGIEICDVYGMSETCGPISISVPGASKGCGVPVMDVKIDKETSEIMVKGDNMFNQYYNMEQYGNKWFATGDTGYIDRDGSLFVTGRIKDIIITHGGENVSPIPIEDKIKSELQELKFDIDHVVLIGNMRKYLTALIFTEDTINEVELDDVINKVNDSAPNTTSQVKKYKIIYEKLEIGQCLTPTLKLRRQGVDDAYRDIIDGMYNI
jgi:long-chain-fatty-acid--CoA ligase ACSBG